MKSCIRIIVVVTLLCVAPFRIPCATNAGVSNDQEPKEVIYRLKTALAAKAEIALNKAIKGSYSVTVFEDTNSLTLRGAPETVDKAVAFLKRIDPVTPAFGPYINVFQLDQRFGATELEWTKSILAALLSFSNEDVRITIDTRTNSLIVAGVDDDSLDLVRTILHPLRVRPVPSK